MTENSFWVHVNEDTLASEDMFDSLSQQFTSDPKARIHKEISSATDKVSTMKKTKELKVLDPKAAQNLSMIPITVIVFKHIFNHFKKLL